MDNSDKEVEVAKFMCHIKKYESSKFKPISLKYDSLMK